MVHKFKLWNLPTLSSLSFFNKVKKSQKVSVLLKAYRWHRFSGPSLGYSYISRWKKKPWVVKSEQGNRGLYLFFKSKFIKGAKYRSKLEKKRIEKEKKEAEKSALRRQKKKPWTGPAKEVKVIAPKEVDPGTRGHFLKQLAKRTAFMRDLASNDQAGVAQLRKSATLKTWRS